MPWQRREFAERREIAGLRRGQAHRRRERDRGSCRERARLWCEHATNGAFVIERKNHHLVERRLRRPLGIGDRRRIAVTPVLRRRGEARLDLVEGAVVAALALGDLGPAGIGAGRADRLECGLGAGIGEADLLDRGDALDDQLGEPDLRLRSPCRPRTGWPACSVTAATIIGWQ